MFVGVLKVGENVGWDVMGGRVAGGDERDVVREVGRGCVVD